MSIINLKFGEKYHLIKEDGNFIVEFSDGKKVLSQTIKDNQSSAFITVDYCEERVKLLNGNYLLRSRDELSIKKE